MCRAPKKNKLDICNRTVERMQSLSTIYNLPRSMYAVLGEKNELTGETKCFDKLWQNGNLYVALGLYLKFGNLSLRMAVLYE